MLKWCPEQIHFKRIFKCLKTHICVKWVYGWETSCSKPIPDFISLCYIAEWGLSGSNWQAHNLKVWTEYWTCFGPQAMFAYPLNLLYLHSAKHRMEMNCGNQHLNASLCAEDSQMTSASLSPNWNSMSDQFYHAHFPI